MSGNDDDIWDYFTQDVKPLAPSSPALTQKEQNDDDTAVVEEQVTKVPEEPKPAPTKEKKTKNPRQPQGRDIDGNTRKKLEKGELPIDGELDLHGMRQAEAHNALKSFIKNSYSSNKRCVLVITGKGARSVNPEHWMEDERGVLRKKLPEWLNGNDLSNIVLQHVQARPKHGGAGAFYIYLRRKRNQ
ncbi:MAG: smr domain-containing protein [Alphaproteobacteria bacterium]|nr:smr domain-containing protein [Alphaproteobacteria bacterium]|tara:strand:- start:1775 stop:2335 length:561 start_codon:yes stop_codon:yes gene_type:complete